MKSILKNWALPGFLAALLGACQPQWQHPLYYENVVSGNFLVGTWIDSNKHTIVNIWEEGGHLRAMLNRGGSVSVGELVVTQGGGQVFLSFVLKGAKFISSGRDIIPDSIPPAGSVSMVLKRDHNLLKVYHIDYKSMAERLSKAHSFPVKNVCKKSTEKSTKIEYKVEMLCYLLDQNDVVKALGDLPFKAQSTPTWVLRKVT